MSPSRRRADGAVRCLASCDPCRAPLRDPPFRTRITRAARWGHRALPSLHPRNSRAALPVGAPHPVLRRRTPVALRAVPRCAILHYTRALPGRRDGDIAPYRHYTRAIPTLHCPWGLPTPGGAMSAAGPPGSRPTAITPATIARYAHAPRRAPLPCAHAVPRCRVLGHNDHSNSRFCLKVRKRLGRSLTFVCGIVAHGNHAKNFRCPILSLNATIICPNPKHRNLAAKQSKDGVFFREKLLRKPALSPDLS